MTSRVNESLSVVVPVYNGSATIEALVESLQSVVVHPQIILVNDRSPDNSWEIIRRVASSYDNVIGVNLRKNAGQDNAIMAGFSYADGDYVVIMDDDLQHDPAHIALLLDGLQTADADVCYANFRNKKQAFWKNIGSWFNGKVAEITLHKPPHIYLSPYKIMQKALVEEIVKYHGPYPYIDGLILRSTDSVQQVDVPHNERQEGESNYNLIRSLRVFLKMVTSFSVYPLRISVILGFVSALVALMLGVYFIAEFFLTGISIEGWTSMMLLILFIGGVIMVSLGITGEYVGRIYMSINRSPQYSVKEVAGAEKAG